MILYSASLIFGSCLKLESAFRRVRHERAFLPLDSLSDRRSLLIEKNVAGSRCFGVSVRASERGTDPAKSLILSAFDAFISDLHESSPSLVRRALNQRERRIAQVPVYCKSEWF